MPDNVCQCFFFSEIDAAEANFSIEQEPDLPTIQVCDSQNVNIPVIEVSGVEESSNISMKNDASSSGESNIQEFSLSPNGLDKLSPDRNSADRGSLTSPRSGENTSGSPITERGNVSSGYALSLHDQSSDQINFTSPSSGEDSKRSSNKETSPSSGYAMSLGEQSFDRNITDPRNITTSPSSGEDSKNGTDMEIEKNGARDLSKIDTDSRCRSKTEYRSSQSSPSEQGQRNIKHLRAGETSKSKSMLKYASNTDSKNKNEYRSSQSSPSEQGQRNVKQLKSKEFSNSESIGYDAYNRTRQNARDIHIGAEFRFENQNIRFASYRPPLPRPFPSVYTPPHQPYMNPPMHTQIQTPYPVAYLQQYPQPFHSYANSATNVPFVQANIPERFPVAPRPHASTSYQRPNREESGSLSKKSLAEAEKKDLQGNIIRVDVRVEDWMRGIPEVGIPPDEEPIAQWSAAENEENEGIAPVPEVPEGPGFPETSPDERSSTEISEEENRRQRSLKRPPRNNKKGRPPK